MLADGAPIRNLTEAVQNAHLEVEAVVASPIAAGFACLTAEERDLGVALVEFGAEVTNVSVYAGGMLVGLQFDPVGSADITDAIACAFGIRRFQAERLKCVHGSAIASPADHREMIPVDGAGRRSAGGPAREADDKNRIPRAELISVITGELDRLISEVAKPLKSMGFSTAERRASRSCSPAAAPSLPAWPIMRSPRSAKPVRIGRPPHLRGLPEAHAVPGFATLAGLVLYAAADPVDIRAFGRAQQITTTLWSGGMVQRVCRPRRTYF